MKSQRLTQLVKLACRSTLALALALPMAAQAVSITIDPGPIGTIITNRDIAFADLTGTPVQGQVLSLNVNLPAGKDAVYRYDGNGARNLYGWGISFNFAGGGTVVSQPGVLSALPLNVFGTAAGPFVGSVTLYNDTYAGYVINYNMQNSSANLIGFTNVPYHSLQVSLRMPTFSQAGAVISGGTFSFNRNGIGEFTEVVASVPEPETYAMLLAGLAIVSTVAARRRAKTQ